MWASFTMEDHGRKLHPPHSRGFVSVFGRINSLGHNWTTGGLPSPGFLEVTGRIFLSNVLLTTSLDSLRVPLFKPYGKTSLAFSLVEKY